MTIPFSRPHTGDVAAGVARTTTCGDALIACEDGFRVFRNPAEIVGAHAVDEVVAALRRVERAVAEGKTAVGYVAYEAAPAFDRALAVHAPGELPLAWFGVYEGSGEAVSGEFVVAEHGSVSDDAAGWTPVVGESAYRSSLARIREYIAAGDTYQVNYTFPLARAYSGDALGTFLDLAASQPTPFGAYLDTGRHRILSVSPELFFRLDGDRVTTRPMKGTAARGLWYEDDCRRAEDLRDSEKERAENVMIVDMVRNDLGRIARTGTVRVESLFDVERYDTVWQMTSTVAAETEASVPEIFRALFPSASVTGAPKVRTMEIIRELETHPRGVYCGAIGRWGPGRQAEFSVGIRTVTIDAESRAATYSVGSGITWDSSTEAEFAECQVKSEVLRRPRPDFDLLESLLWDGAYFLLEEHLDRLERSAAYFGIPVARTEVARALEAFAPDLSAASKVRLRVSRRGRLRVEAEPAQTRRVVRVGLAPEPIDCESPFLYHKTTRRDVYERMRGLCPEWDDVLLWNARGELTESTTANVVVRMNGRWYTPPVASGLLGGVMRRHLLEAGTIEEAVLPVGALAEAEEIKLINSVRKWIDVDLVEMPRVTALGG